MYLFQHEKTRSGYHPFIHLHSTMYLFQLYIIKNLNIQVIIYIPLCIYFNQFTKSERVQLEEFTFHYVSISTVYVIAAGYCSGCIYIPLCIYFNFAKASHSSFLPYLHSTMYLFQLLWMPDTPLLRYYLHSTMYLFQPKVPWRCRNSMKIYIPLCIYFNATILYNIVKHQCYLHSTMYLFQQMSRVCSVTEKKSFTFHYVSIST